jgi:hypothetical protein
MREINNFLDKYKEILPQFASSRKANRELAFILELTYKLVMIGTWLAYAIILVYIFLEFKCVGHIV